MVIPHSIGWGMTIQDMKWIFDWLTVHGVDWFVVHAYYYTTNGLKKHDAPPSAFYQMPWWKDMKLLSEYAGQLIHTSRTCERKVPVLLVDPVTSVWTAKEEDKEPQSVVGKSAGLLYHRSSAFGKRNGENRRKWNQHGDQWGRILADRTSFHD